VEHAQLSACAPDDLSKPATRREREQVMRSIRGFSAALARDQRGLSTVEYAIILCLIVAFAVGTWETFGQRVKDSLEKSSNDINEKIN
jgi:Flp pilus assembly pilin Flp